MVSFRGTVFAFRPLYSLVFILGTNNCALDCALSLARQEVISAVGFDGQHKAPTANQGFLMGSGYLIQA